MSAGKDGGGTNTYTDVTIGTVHGWLVGSVHEFPRLPPATVTNKETNR